VWEEAPGRADSMCCAAVWCADEPRFVAFAQTSHGTVLSSGHGLPGRVWASGAPAWITDVQADPNFPRAQAAVAAGLHAGFCFPIGTARGVVGVIEFLTTKLREPDDHLLATVGSIGSHIGQFVERSRAEGAIHEREARHAAMFQAALDCIVTIDDRGRVLEFNAAAEQTFGYTAEEASGRELAELIVPPALRDAHRRGFARYLQTGRARVLDRRLELVGMRADGSEFPVELTIVRIQRPGPPVFTGFLRDISERKLAETELRASRVRLVQAQDTERRRLERNLHDGAQQRLVSLALLRRLARDKTVDPQDGAAELLDDAREELEHALAELRELARGIHPAILTERGLRPALEGVAARAPIPVELTALPRERLPHAIEAAAYYVICEALTNVAKYANATGASVSVVELDGRIVIEIADDGVGGAVAEEGSGLRGLADRVEALEGRLEVQSEPAGGTRLRADIPLT
jgi:PAS domain S-box-containing protein